MSTIIKVIFDLILTLTKQNAHPYIFRVDNTEMSQKTVKYVKMQKYDILSALLHQLIVNYYHHQPRKGDVLFTGQSWHELQNSGNCYDKKTTTVTSTSILLMAGCVHHICYNLSYSVGNFEIIITPAITQQCYYKWQKIKRGNEMSSIAMQW